MTTTRNFVRMALIALILLHGTVAMEPFEETETPICAQPLDLGKRCRGQEKTRIQRWHFNASTNTYSSFKYRGCNGNMNRFESEELCMTTTCDPYTYSWDEYQKNLENSRRKAS
uniref:Putative bpti/kunitz family of serine protease inhibitor n=1 Tax=Amblyomma americanum TaxID=6943 RepID=A0A0C9SET4_AMBAM